MANSGTAKLDQVTKLLDELKADLDGPKLSHQQRKEKLEQLKVHGRSPQNADPIFSEQGIRTLSRYAFETSDAETSREALRCLANTMLLVPSTRQTFVDLGNASKIAEKLKSDNIDDEFLSSRLLFLMTYETKLDYKELVSSSNLADSVNAALERHASRYSDAGKDKRDKHTAPMDLMALSEILKLLFNITHFFPGLATEFSKSTSAIFKILLSRPIPNPPLQPPLSALINALLNLPLNDSDKDAFFPPSDPSSNASHLIHLLDLSTIAYPESDLDANVSPLLTLIRRMYESAPDSVKKEMERLLLPTDEERARPLGKSDSLSSRLLQLSTSALAPNLRTSISAFFFELSGKDAAKFVHNVGYGFASGFLISNNIPMPEHALHDQSTGPSDSGGIPVNPITGQRLDMEEPDTSTPMTMEEREREAERLFVLFERLKATGVVNVENPVAEAYRSGRIQELSDDEEVD
ncbi:uncharacterized protein EI97DRAFT_434932 [Westerdykella ornata]|uniref:Guanine nucleotide exchange factor n=1 Tax=Westerdykella ornata TaxID=318751 RepID=A0A6A6JDR7_WESOR|nr:uncharacterized protein EI97DRAFT_434932 [Westerdykella ornata]KAF2274701.1 hypothetical protein EI97DRAFT_434932 [Westerdykella ornata]